MLRTVLARIEGRLAEGASVEDIVASKPIATLDSTLGQGFMKPDTIVRLVATSLRDERGAPAEPSRTRRKTTR